MLDSSPSVRDAAIELVGKYVVTRRDFALEYLPKIAERINVSLRRLVSQDDLPDDVRVGAGHRTRSSTKSCQAIEISVPRRERRGSSGRDLSQVDLASFR